MAQHIYGLWTASVGDRVACGQAWTAAIERVENLLSAVGTQPRRDSLLVAETGIGKVASGRWTGVRMRRILDMYNARRAEKMSAWWIYSDLHEIAHPADVYLSLVAREHCETPVAFQLEVHISPSHLSVGQEAAVGEGFRSWLSPLAAMMNADHAFVTKDRNFGVQAVPYEVRNGINMDGAARAGEHPRGYYWANLLNPLHLERLGGLERVSAAAESAGLLVEPHFFDTGDLKHAVLRVPGPITQCANTQLEAVEEILHPVLLKRDQAVE